MVLGWGACRNTRSIRIHDLMNTTTFMAATCVRSAAAVPMPKQNALLGAMPVCDAGVPGDDYHPHISACRLTQQKMG